MDCLFPSSHTEFGITEFDFQVARTREQIIELFDKVGIRYKLGKFNAIYNRARELCGSHNDKVSVRSMMQSVEMMHGLE